MTLRQVRLRTASKRLAHFPIDLTHLAVMAGLVPAIHALLVEKKDVDARHKAGHDGEVVGAIQSETALAHDSSPQFGGLKHGSATGRNGASALPDACFRGQSGNVVLDLSLIPFTRRHY
jgi:hypothetical protein